VEYKTIEAANHQEALKIMRKEYGSDARIISQDKVSSKGFFGRMSKKNNKIKLYIQIPEKKQDTMKSKMQFLENMVESRKRDNNKLNDLIINSIATSKTNTNRKNPDSYNTKIEAKPSILKNFDTNETITYSKTNESYNEDLIRMQADISFIKDNLSSLSHQNQNFHYEKDFKLLYDSLLEHDFSKTWVESFIKEVRSNMPSNEWKLKKRIYVKAVELLSNKIKVKPYIAKERIVALLGPTGVGKTTTLAKLATPLKLRDEYSIKFINLDNYRIGATEQLKKYAEIFQAPFSIGNSPEVFKKLLNEQFDVFLVDTPGFNPRNEEFLSQIKEFFVSSENNPLSHYRMEKFLVISASTKRKDAERIIDTYDQFNIDRIILSKIDETIDYGFFIELAEAWNKPFAFLTMGQGVPDAIKEANRKEMAEEILTNFYNSGLS